jgi:hypothetical protein
LEPFAGPGGFYGQAFELEGAMNNLIYLVGLVVVVLAVLAFFGLR